MRDLDLDDVAATSPVAKAELAALRAEVADLRELYDGAMKALGFVLGENVNDEPRFKWVNLAAIRVVQERDALREQVERLENGLLDLKAMVDQHNADEISDETFVAWVKLAFTSGQAAAALAQAQKEG